MPGIPCAKRLHAVRLMGAGAGCDSEPHGGRSMSENAIVLGEKRARKYQDYATLLPVK